MRCPNVDCQSELQIPPGFCGHQWECVGCGMVFRLSQDGTPADDATPQPAPLLEADTNAPVILEMDEPTVLEFDIDTRSGDQEELMKHNAFMAPWVDKINSMRRQLHAGEISREQFHAFIKEFVQNVVRF